MQFFVRLSFCINFAIVKTKENIDLHQQFIDVSFHKMINSSCVVDHHLVNFPDVESSQNADFGVELEGVVAACVASLAAMAKPAHDFVHQEVRVERVVEVHVICALQKVELGQALAVHLTYEEVGREFRHDANSSHHLLVVDALSFFVFVA